MKNTLFKTAVCFTVIFLFSYSPFAAETKKAERDDFHPKTKAVVTDGSPTVTTNSSTTSPTTDNTKTETSTTSTGTAETKKADWQAMTMGGGVGTSSRFILTSSVGQTFSGSGTTGTLELSSDFLQNFSPAVFSCCIGNRGNIDGDPNDVFDIADIVYMVNWLFNDGPAPPCKDEANVVVEDPDIADLVYFVSYMFSDGPPPQSCDAFLI